MIRRKVSGRGKCERKAFLEYMTPRFWRIHYLVPATIGLFFLGIALGIAHNTSFKPQGAQATAADNVTGWGWTPNAGWISLNDQNPSSCASAPCGTYGLYANPTPSAQPDGGTGHSVNGFAWSDNLGFICFGTSCNIAACTVDRTSLPGGTMFAYIQSLSGSTVKEVKGWAGVCSQKDAGWISLNCANNNYVACPGGAADKKFRIVYNPATKQFFADPFAGLTAANQGVSYAYNGNTAGNGFGYISFYPSVLGMRVSAAAETTYGMCHDTVDNDLSGFADCVDTSCTAVCAENCSNGLDDDSDSLVDCADTVDCSCTETICNDNIDNDFDGPKDCADTDCAANPICLPENNCTDGLDNDGDTSIDCADTDCASNPACVPPQHQCAAFVGDPDRANKCCNDINDNFTGLVDCIDPNCRNNATVCSAWLRVEAGNIYSGAGVTGTTPSLQTGKSNAAYCLRSDESVYFTSDIACKEEAAATITLPSASTKYRNTLGFLDLAGIRAGRYGKIIDVPVNGGAILTADLNGQVYRYAQTTPLHITARTFNNGSGTYGNGAGLLLVEGTDLYIDGNISYTAVPVQSRLKNLASFGVIVVKDAGGGGGNIYIGPAVATVSGAYFAEGEINTGTNASGLHNDTRLQMYGVFVARRFGLLRDNNSDPNLPAEKIIFDGRAVVNPPPGMQDITKSLPQTADANFQ